MQTEELHSKLGLNDSEYQEIINQLGREPNETELYLFSAMWSEHCGYSHSKKYLSRFPKNSSIFPKLHSKQERSFQSRLGLLPQQHDADYALNAVQENADGIKIGNHAIVFKVESHNHPCAVEPFQGAATGIGGIIRDILALGARPIALLDSLKFGKIKNNSNVMLNSSAPLVAELARLTRESVVFDNQHLKGERPCDPESSSGRRNFTKHTFDGVVRGISVYGNSIGVPTLGGEVCFESCYENSPLVNVMAVGLVNMKDIKTSVAGLDQYIVILGSLTGRDGIHGASFASKELGKNSKEDRPSVQIADPFMKKVLIEATLEILKSENVLACQDCGAAGILSSTSEMAYKGNCGLELYLDKVQLRENDMEPWEIMLSESQERMIFSANKKGVEEILKIAKKYEIPASEIGKTIEEKEYKLFWHDNADLHLNQAVCQGSRVGLLTHHQKTLNANRHRMIANVSPEILNNPPLYDLCEDEPEYIKEYENKVCSQKISVKEAVKKLVSDPNFASKNWIYSQYDYTVGNRTCIVPSGAGCAGALIKEIGGIIGFTMDSNGRQVFLDPYQGSKNTVYESYRNLVSSGFKPLGITNCLNFGNPEKDEVGYQFVKSVDGIADACKELEIPVVSGNVSFYNECEEVRVYPTPTIGMVGVCESYDDIILSKFGRDEESKVGILAHAENIYLIGKQIENNSKIGSSLYQKICFDFLGGKIDSVDSELEKNLAKTVFELRDKNILTGAIDVSEGGIIGALLEGLFNSNTGFEGNLIKTINQTVGRAYLPDIIRQLFGEITGRYLISTANTEEFEKICKKNNTQFKKLGKTTNTDEILFDGYKFNLYELKNIWEKSIQKEMENV